MAINVDEVYAGSSMNAAYVKENFGVTGKRLKIEDVTVAEFGDEGEEKKRKVVLAFVGEKKTLPLNVTNKSTLKDAFGSDAEAWVGKTILVKTHKIPYSGKMVDGVLVEPNQDVQVGPVLGEEGAHAIRARMTTIGAANPKHDMAFLRSYLILVAPQHADAIQGEVKDWPATLKGNIRSWLDNPRADDSITDTDLPF